MADGKPGAPVGNQNGVKKNKLFGEMLRRVIVQDDEAIDGKPSRLRKICLALVEKAEGGDIQAIKEVRDTLDGKPVQQIAGTGDEGQIILHITASDAGVL